MTEPQLNVAASLFVSIICMINILSSMRFSKPFRLYNCVTSWTASAHYFVLIRDEMKKGCLVLQKRYVMGKGKGSCWGSIHTLLSLWFTSQLVPFNLLLFSLIFPSSGPWYYGWDETSVSWLWNQTKVPEKHSAWRGVLWTVHGEYKKIFQWVAEELDRFTMKQEKRLLNWILIHISNSIVF